MGFSLIELMIVIAIIGVLAAIAVPSYQRYTKRARYSEIVQAAVPYKLGVVECFHVTGALEDCHSGQYGIPPLEPAGQFPGLVQQVQVEQGVITVIPKDQRGFTASDTYQLTPVIQGNQLSWQVGGGGVSAGYAR